MNGIETLLNFKRRGTNDHGGSSGSKSKKITERKKPRSRFNSKDSTNKKRKSSKRPPSNPRSTNRKSSRTKKKRTSSKRSLRGNLSRGSSLKEIMDQQEKSSVQKASFTMDSNNVSIKMKPDSTRDIETDSDEVKVKMSKKGMNLPPMARKSNSKHDRAISKGSTKKVDIYSDFKK